MGNIVIRPLESWEELAEAEAIQREAWGDDPRYLMHQHMLVSIARNGGVVLGAFDGSRMVGLAVGFLGADDTDLKRPAMANLKLFSKRVVVLEAYQGQGVGYRLKLAQRDFAMQRGIRLITWTFDPLLSRNAHMNIRKLGAVAAHYYVDFYGPDAGPLALAGASDRFQVDWWLTSARVVRRLEGSRNDLTLAQYLSGGARILNPSTLISADLPAPSEDFIQPTGALGLVEIPSDYQRIVKADPGLARAWREHSRAIFTAIMGDRYIVTDFLHETHEGRQRSFYVCSHEGALSQFSRN